MGKNNDLLAHIERDYTAPVRDPLWGHIYLSPAMLELISTAQFQRLSRLKQLGPAHLVYPGATHTRLSHSLGVFHIARQILTRLAKHPQAPRLSRKGGTAFLAAALLHDLGHFPYAHGLCHPSLDDHEVLTGRGVQEGAIARILRQKVRANPQSVAAIVDKNLALPRGQKNEITLYRRLLSGSLDPDKLDYLNRDAYYCGVPYGQQDLDFTLSRIVPNGYNGIGLAEDGVASVENILFSKYLMYRAVYWHRTVRVTTAMVNKAIGLGLKDNQIQAEELYKLDDYSFVNTIGERDYAPFSLLRRLPERDLLKTVVLLPFDSNNTAMAALADSEECAAREESAVEFITQEMDHASNPYEVIPYEVIIDLPTEVSFEVHFPIFSGDNKSEFVEKSAFTPKIIQDFTAKLRAMRLIASTEVAQFFSQNSHALARLQRVLATT